MSNQNDDLAAVESLIVWMQQRPHMYCPLLGELDSVQWYLHMVWAKLAKRDAEYSAAKEAAGLTTMGLLSSEQRHLNVAEDDPSTQRVLNFWREIDRILDIKIRLESW